MRALRDEEIPAYYRIYSQKVPEGDLLKLMKKTFKETRSLLKKVDEAKGDYRYAEDKWTLKEVLIHMIDTEHIFGCRALRVARDDKTPLPSFEQNDFVRAVDVSNRTIKDLLKEFKAMRRLTIAMFRHFDDEMFDRIGTVTGNPMSARALAHIIIGHEIHHREVIKERYL